jgi:2-polyprenyl-3-methyl-5-hydroxy-6-metoxy-1,4-benzoquinol methylase
VKFENLHTLLAQLEADTSLFAPGQLRQRIEALDQLDSHIEIVASEAFTPLPADAAILDRSAILQRNLESANAVIYSAIRKEIQQGNAGGLRGWIDRCWDNDYDPKPGLGYDYLDDLVAGVLQIPDPVEVIRPGPEQVFYQPTPVRHALALIEQSGLSEDDVLVDFGSGLGQFCVVASMLTGAQVTGIEIERAYVESARECVRNLRLPRIEFLHSDAREADLSAGTVFHLFTPFTGSILRTVLDRLRHESTKRSIKVCTLGPCTQTVAREPWLRTNMQPDPECVTVFCS